MRTQLTLSQELKLFAASVLLGVAVYSCSGQELSTFYTAEIYNQTGEVKSGLGLRARYWWDQWGIEADGMSLTPKDSIIDRSDLSLAWRYQFGRGEACRRFQAPLLARSGQGSDVRGSTQARSGISHPPSHPLSLILSAGIGANFEDDAWGPGGGAAIQYRRGRIGAEIGARLIQEDQSKTLLTSGMNWRF